MKYISRVFVLFTAFIAGYIIYVLGIFSMPYIGLFGTIFQLILGVIVTGIFVATSLFLGFIFRKYIFKKFHINKSVYIIITSLSIILIIFGSKIGLTQQYTDPELGKTFQSLNAMVALSCYVLVIFCVTNWPIEIKKR